MTKESIPIICLLITLLLFSACQFDDENQFFVIGQIEGAAGKLYLLEQKTFELQRIDSVEPADKGRFQCSVEADETSIYALRVAPGEQVVFIASPGDTIRITGNPDHYPFIFQVAGNVESELLQAFYTYSAGNLRKVDSLQLLIEMNQGESDFYELTVMVDSMFNQIWETQRQYEKAFILEHAGAFSTLLVVNYHFGVRPVLSPGTDAVDYRRVDSGLMVTYPGNRHTLFFHQWLKEIK
ncbi:MAG: DUF4369 domain-containing protein [Bacteroidia bacterium]|nr:DUF4369 domain-containing protein [Bacteroidia bacterium]